ncbi:MAG: tyrosine-type recombinase/integrase [Pseudomonadales bacterium]
MTRRRSDGSVVTHYYHRRTNKRIDGEFGSPEFLASYAQAARFDREPSQWNLAGLLQRYRQSSAYLDLAESTRRNYEPILASIRDAWGDMPLTVVEDRSVRDGIIESRDSIAQRSRRQADYYVSVLSAVLTFGVEIGAIERNHARGIGRLYKVNRTDRIWLPEDIAKFDSVSSPELRLALKLALHTGQRQGDLLTLPWSAFDGAAISLRQSKTGRDVFIPCTKALRSALELAPRRSTLILTNTRGKPWTSDGFKTSWGKVCKRAGIDGLTFQDLRGTTVTMLSKAGCTVPEIAAITGHTIRSATSILETYLSRTKGLATAAIVKLDEHRRQNESGT